MINDKMTVGEYKEFLDDFLASHELDDDSIMPWPPMPLEYVNNVLCVNNNRLLEYVVERMPGSYNTLASVGQKIIERREGALTRIHPANTQNTPDNLVWVGESDAAKRQED